MRADDRSLTVRAVILTGAIAAMLMMASQAIAAGPVIKLGSPAHSGPPSVAVGPGGTVIAWANSSYVAGTPSTVQYCLVARGGTGCQNSGALQLAGGASEVDGVHVVVDDGRFYILVDVYGGGLASQPVQEWQSLDGGATFDPVDEGLSVSSGFINADTASVGAVIVPSADPSTDELGLGSESPVNAPTFNAFPEAYPPECSLQNDCPAGFATLEPASNPDAVGNGGGAFASRTVGVEDGVLGVFETIFTSGPLGCPDTAKSSSAGSAFAYGAGDQSPTNNYDISPGQPDSAWRVPVTQADCSVEDIAVDGGLSGFGIIENEVIPGSTAIYRRFDTTTQRFDTNTVIDSQGEQDPSVEQDGGGVIFGTYLVPEIGGPLRLALGYDYGEAFTKPVTLDANRDDGIQNPTSAVNQAGAGFAAWLDRGSVYGTSFSATDAVTPAAVAPAVTSTAGTVTVTVTCAAFPCTITLTLSGPGSLLVAPSALHHASTTTHPKRVTLATRTFKLKSKGAKHLKVKLDERGRRLLAGRHGTIDLTLGVAERTLGVTVKNTHAVRVTLLKSTK